MIDQAIDVRAHQKRWHLIGIGGMRINRAQQINFWHIIAATVAVSSVSVIGNAIRLRMVRL